MVCIPWIPFSSLCFILFVRISNGSLKLYVMISVTLAIYINVPMLQNVHDGSFCTAQGTGTTVSRDCHTEYGNRKAS